MPHKLDGKWGWVKGSKKPNYEARLHNWLVTQSNSPHPTPHVFLYVSVGSLRGVPAEAQRAKSGVSPHPTPFFEAGSSHSSL